ncbi:MAG TPA: GAF domain-containing protein, partial [Longimicrobium sp.]|nr:GAF domain-containing protein [Longimicrobium sp.]
MSASEIQLPVPPDYGHALDPLLRACGSIADAPRLDAALRAACAAAVDALGFHHAAAVVLESRGTQATVAAEHPARGTEGAHIPLNDLSVLQGAARSRVPLQVGDALADPALQALRPLLEAAGIRAVLALPILRGERLLGWLSVHDTQAPRAFTPADVSRGQMLARQLGPLVENDRLREQART